MGDSKQVRDWKGKKIYWQEVLSVVGWTTRLIVLACLMFTAFAQWVLPTEFAGEHPAFIWVFVAVYALATAYRLAQFAHRFRDGYPQRYSLRAAFCYSDHSPLGWLNHKLIPFGYYGRPAWRAYGTYFALAFFLLISNALLRWYDAPALPEPPAQPSAIQIWAQGHSEYFGWAFATIVIGAIAVALVTWVVRSTKRRWTQPHIAARDEALAKNKVLDETCKKLAQMLKAEQESAKKSAAELEQWGELLAQAALLLKRVPAKRGDGDIGEARVILEHVLEARIIPDVMRRQAALFRVVEKLDNKDRVRFQPPKQKAAA